MSWHFSRALVEAYSVANSLDGEQSAPWNSTPTALDDSCSDKMKGTCHRSPYGMMFVPSTDSRGEVLLMWFLEGFRAKTFQRQDAGPALKVKKVVFGGKCSESFAKYDPITALWKTRQFSLLGGLVSFSATWPRWGTMRNGACSEQFTPEYLIEGKEYGFSEALWPTATVNGWRSEGSILQLRAKVENLEISEAMAMAMAMGSLRPQRMKTWPTPCAASHGKSNGGHSGLAGGSGNRQKLYNMLGKEEGKKLGCQSLNPNWVEWLMGWVIGWTDSRPLGTDRFLLWLDSHGKH